jgi:hypothetical protein
MRSLSKTAFNVTFTVAASLLITCSHAFWEFGHIFVARAAYDMLQSTRDGRHALDKAN